MRSFLFHLFSTLFLHVSNTLLDHLIVEPRLNNIGYCNELNAGYVLNGYAMSREMGVCVVTFIVDGLSILNTVATLMIMEQIKLSIIRLGYLTLANNLGVFRL